LAEKRQIYQTLLGVTDAFAAPLACGCIAATVAIAKR
jgi:hypothetical protein